MDKNIYFDDQGGKNMVIIKDDVAPCILLNSAEAHALIICRVRTNGDAQTQPRKHAVDKR